MKLRFDKNSIRLRVKKSDLEMLREENAIQETVSFPNESLKYRLAISRDIDEVTARIQGSSVEVIIPATIAEHWMINDETGIYHTITFADNHSLDIIIEKDFPCKNREEEDPSNSFSELSSLILPKQC